MLKIKKGVFVFTFFLCLLGFEKELISGYAAAIAHESAHLVAALFFGCRAKKFSVGICTVCLELDTFPKSKEHLIILAAGPLCSFFLFGILFLQRLLFGFNQGVFEFANLCIFCANLLPLSPLDGGEIIKIILCRRLGVIKGARLSSKICVCLGYILFVLNLFALFFCAPNPFLMFFFSFVLFSVLGQNRKKLLYTKNVLTGSIERAQETKVFSLKSDCRLLDAASRISPSYYSYCTVFDNERFIGEICQEEIIGALSLFGAGFTLGEYIEQKDRLYTIEKSLKT